MKSCKMIRGEKYMNGGRISNDDSLLRFPCPIDGSIVSLQDCSECKRSIICDIYATMLDEDYK